MELMIAVYPTVNIPEYAMGKKTQQNPIKILQDDLIRKVTVMNTNKLD